jgi:hypothetical protein
LENVNDIDNVNRAWENITDDRPIEISAKEILDLHEWKQYKSWFGEEYSQFLYYRKRAKMP